jgi:transcription elongation factor GreA
MDDKFPMTPAGHRKLKAELRQVRDVDRHENVREIEAALEHGDLKENAEYHAAKERQAQINGRMRMLEYHLAHAVVIDPATVKSEKVAFGATVTLTDLDSDEVVVYAIVGEDEADAERGLINVNSPIARAMIGKSEGDEVLVKLPRGDREFELMSLEFKPVS